LLDRRHLGEREDILRGNRQVVIDVRDTYNSAKRMREVFYGKAQRGEKTLPFMWPRFVRYLGPTNAEIYFSDKTLAKGKWDLFKHIVEGPQFLFSNPAVTKLVNDYGEEVEIKEAGRRLRVEGQGGRVSARVSPVSEPRFVSKEQEHFIPTAFSARSYEITGPMPNHIADLADNKGVQWVARAGRLGQVVFFESRIPNSKLAGARMPLPPSLEAKYDDLCEAIEDAKAHGKRSEERDLESDIRAMEKRMQVILLVYSREGVHFMITGERLNVTKDGIVG
jgi:hypothetical protein